MDKRRQVLDGAFKVFARDGYSRASIDAIAAAAGVSSRTIYNHFRDKADLFKAVIVESATHVADTQISLMDRHLLKVTDLEADLVAFGRAWLTPTRDHAEHFAMVRHIEADAAHIPTDVNRAWLDAGPLRVRRELARRFQQLATEGLLTVADADRAALHFSQLVSTDDPTLRRTRRDTTGIDAIVHAAVHAFLYGYITSR